MFLLFGGSSTDNFQYNRGWRAGQTASPGLHAVRTNADRDTQLEHFDDLMRVGVRCALPGWLQRMEVTIKAKSVSDAYTRQEKHHGNGFFLYDRFLDKPIVDGWVYEITTDGRMVTYVVGGAWKRTTDDYETHAPAGKDSGTYLGDVLSDHCPAANSDQSNIATTGTTLAGAFNIDADVGTYPKDIIEALLPMGTSTSGEILDFWFQPATFSGLFPQLPLAYLQARDTNAAVDWQIDRSDCANIGTHANIYDFANNVRIAAMEQTTLTAGASSGATSLTVNSISGFSDNDEIFVTMDSGTKHRTTINGTPSGSTINIDNALTHAAASGNLVSRVELAQTSVVTDSDSQAALWERRYREKQGGMNQTQGGQYANVLLANRKDPVQGASFTIGSKWIRDGAGARWPLWRMLIAPSKIRINDLLPLATSTYFDTAPDSLSVLWTAALDWDSISNQMRVTPDVLTFDRSLWVMLQQRGYPVGQPIYRAA